MYTETGEAETQEHLTSNVAGGMNINANISFRTRYG